MSTIIEHIGINQGLSPWNVLIGTLGMRREDFCDDEEIDKIAERSRNSVIKNHARSEETKNRIYAVICKGEYKVAQICDRIGMKGDNNIRRKLHELESDGFAKSRKSAQLITYWSGV